MQTRVALIALIEAFFACDASEDFAVRVTSDIVEKHVSVFAVGEYAKVYNPRAFKSELFERISAVTPARCKLEIRMTVREVFTNDPHDEYRLAL